MVFTCSNNPIDRFSCWFENSIIEPLSRYYYRHKKSHYKCIVCGRIEAPYFTEEEWASITKDMGWHKFKDSNRWVCHYCADHGFSPSFENGRLRNWEHPWTWDEWQEFVKKDNNKVLTAIKEKDPEYYEYWFDGGRERKLFGDDEDE